MSGYRADLDGLRAIAVLLVVFHHAFPDAVPGGYIGVDVFFVLSGYLISSIIIGELDSGRFSVLTFYERRARRILPALFTVLLASAAFAFSVLLASDLVRFCRTWIATVLFASNMYFSRGVDYFSPSAETNLLLHTWSLAVEEQYYLLFPYACLLLHRRNGKAAIRIAIWATIATSVALGIWLTANIPLAGFYLAPSRAWELLLGAVLVLHRAPLASRGGPHVELLSMAGLASIVVAAALFTRATPFPGLAALAPCLGTLLLIGTGTTPTWIATRLLSSRPCVFVGLISYSLYLWHWPLLGGIRYLQPEPTLGMLVLAIAGSVALAALSWRYIEQPFRRRGADAVPAPKIWVGAGLATVAALAIAGAGIKFRGLPNRHPELATPIPGRELYRERLCFLQRFQEPDDWGGDACFLVTGKPSNALLWGDSFAAHYAPGFTLEPDAASENILLLALSSCPPTLLPTPDYPLCGLQCPCLRDHSQPTYR